MNGIILCSQNKETNDCCHPSGEAFSVLKNPPDPEGDHHPGPPLSPSITRAHPIKKNQQSHYDQGQCKPHLQPPFPYVLHLHKYSNIGSPPTRPARRDSFETRRSQREDNFWRIGKIPILQKLLRPSAKIQIPGAEPFLSVPPQRDRQKNLFSVRSVLLTFDFLKFCKDFCVTLF